MSTEQEKVTVYDGEPVDLVACAIQQGCVMPEMKRVCGGKGWAIYACVDMNKKTRDKFKPLLWAAGTLPHENAEKEKKAESEARINLVVRHFLKTRPWLIDKDYRGAC